MATVKQRQDAFLEILKKNGAFRITEACKVAGISRVTFYRWMKQAKFKRRYDDLVESLKDMAEGKLIDLVEDGRLPAIKYYLNCRAKDRGYGRADASRPLSDPARVVMVQYRDGDFDVVQAATELAILGEPLPEVIRLQLQRTPAPEPEIDDSGISYEELDKMYAEYKEESESEHAWLEQRRSDVAKMKRDFENESRGRVVQATENAEGVNENGNHD